LPFELTLYRSTPEVPIIVSYTLKLMFGIPILPLATYISARSPQTA